MSKLPVLLSDSHPLKEYLKVSQDQFPKAGLSCSKGSEFRPKSLNLKSKVASDCSL